MNKKYIDLIKEALLTSTLQHGQDTFSVPLVDCLPEIRFEKELIERIIKYSGIFKDAKLITMRDKDNLKYMIILPIYNDLYKLIKRVYKEEQKFDEFKTTAIRTAIDLIDSIYFRFSEDSWFDVSINPEILILGIEGVVYIIDIVPVSQKEQHERIKNIVFQLLLNALQTQKFQPHVRVRITEQMKKKIEEIKRTLDSDNPVDETMEDLKLMNLLTPDGIPKLNRFEFVKKAEKYIKRKLNYPLEIKPKTCKNPACKKKFIPERATREYCYDPKCKVYHNRDEFRKSLKFKARQQPLGVK